jgi:glutamine synthetase
MSSRNARPEAIRAIAAMQPVSAGLDYTKKPLTDLFGEDAFNLATLKKVLPKEALESILRTIERGEKLDATHANVIANAMREWAMARGATHFCHWFQPMTGATAEKHDAFITYTPEGRAIADFSGKNLIQGEPDASSFPSGGIRATFEARGYTAWDPTSPAFLVSGTNGKTLVIPTAFCGWGGQALDEKTPLLRSIDVVNRQALRLLKLLGRNDVSSVRVTVGPEQEYFLIDRQFYLMRPDVLAAGRSLFGARPPKGQEMEDHYFGSIRPRILAFMHDAEAECYRVGIPIKTRHNEVAPAQFEVAPVFEAANVAADHNMVVMEIFRQVANRHGLQILFHEKPFAGVNGSGKHANWSMSTDKGENLLDPGHTPEENAQFLVFLTAVIRAAWQWGKLLRVGVAHAGNDHRLGASEAPPAIVSVYLGEKLTDVVEGLIKGAKGKGRAAGTLDIGVQALPALPRDASDRNRTSPFAFTGNKFEFRMVGASQAVARPVTFVNAAVSESMDYMAGEIEKKTSGGQSLHDAVNAVVRETLAACRGVLWNGDNYSKEWHAEAERRGLPNLRNAVDAIQVLRDKDVVQMLSGSGILSGEEVASRHTVMLENYSKTINIEALVTSNIGRRMLLPAAFEYQRRLAETVLRTKEASKRASTAAAEEALNELTIIASRLSDALASLERVHSGAEEHHGDVAAHAKFYRDKVVPAMNAVREAADALELVMDDDLWPLPKYREILFIY